MSFFDASSPFNLFSLLALIGGLCLFLFGMNLMGSGLERRAGNQLKTLLGKFTDNPVKGFFTGLGVTAVIQSSSVTTVMVVGFVNSGIMTLRQSISVIMGANLGTTVTAWILSLCGISGDNFWVQLLKPQSFTPLLALLGTVLFMFFKKDKHKDTGTVLLGFATLMFGMTAMSDAVAGLAGIPAFQTVFLWFKNPILGVLAGAILTAIIQSSSASVGILQALSVTGQVSVGAAIPIIMGQNIGTCVTALLSSFGTNKNAKRAAVVHLSFNVIGTVVWLAVYWLVELMFAPGILDDPVDHTGIALVHSAFNLLCTLLLLPMSRVLEKLAFLFVPAGKEEESFAELDERLLATPSVALDQCFRLLCKLAADICRSVSDSCKALQSYDETAALRVRKTEKNADRYEDMTVSYLTKLSKTQVSDEDGQALSGLLKAVGDWERISDHCVNLLEAAEELEEKKVSLPDSAKEELQGMCRAVEEILDLTYRSFAQNDGEAACRVEPLEQVIDGLKKRLRDSHILRLEDSEYTVSAGFIWSDLLTDLERISDHCSNLAVTVLERNTHTMESHRELKILKKENPQFRTLYAEYAEKYGLKGQS